jgi:hypothetical protein
MMNGPRHQSDLSRICTCNDQMHDLEVFCRQHPYDGLMAFYVRHTGVLRLVCIACLTIVDELQIAP